MKEVVSHTISSNEMARIGKVMHSILMQNIRFTLGKMNISSGKYLAQDSASYDLPREVAEVVARDAKFDWTQMNDVSEHFEVLLLEKAASKAVVQKKVKEVALVKQPVSFDFDVNKAISSVDLVALVNQVRFEESRPELSNYDFMKKIAKVLGKDAGKFSGMYKDQYGRDKTCYYLPQREASLMVMSESYKVQAKVYDRMKALESPVSNPALPNYPEALRQLACAMELAAEQEKKLLEAAPMIDFHHAVTAAENAHTFEEAAKVLNVGRNTFMGILRDNKLLTKANLPAQTSINQGHFTVIEDPYTNSKGVSMLRASPRITGKGLTFIQKLI